MKKFLFSILSIFLIFLIFINFTGEAQVPDSKETFTGSFIDFTGKSNWSQLKWESQFQEMIDIGMNTAIIQFISYNDTTWFKSGNDFTRTKIPDALPTFLAAANNKKMNIIMGSYFDEDYWKNQTNVEWLRLHADRQITSNSLLVPSSVSLP